MNKMKRQRSRLLNLMLFRIVIVNINQKKDLVVETIVKKEVDLITNLEVGTIVKKEVEKKKVNLITNLEVQKEVETIVKKEV